eukprot:2325058-Pyramimonas_sp.AAC.1
MQPRHEAQPQQAWGRNGNGTRKAQELMHWASQETATERHSLVCDLRAPGGHVAAVHLVKGGRVCEKRQEKGGYPGLPFFGSKVVQQLEHLVIGNWVPMMALEGSRLERNVERLLR